MPCGVLQPDGAERLSEADEGDDVSGSRVGLGATAIIIEEAGKMMCERQYMAFADSFDGGKLTETQAKNQWLVWKEQAMEPGSTWPAKDYKGPGGELRLWVKTDDSIRFQNKSEWSKTVQGRSKDIKNPKEIERTWRFTLEDKPSMDTPLTSAM